MNTKLKYLAILAILPLFTIGLATSMNYAEALKSQGTPSQQYGSATARTVCGGQLCSEYPGGYDAWVKDQGKSSKIGSTATPPTPAPKAEAPAMEEKPAMKDKHMDEKMMMGEKKEHKASPGSLLKLSRANVPAEIHYH